MADSEDPGKVLDQVDTLALPVGVIDLDSRDIVAINKQALRLVGRDADQTVGHPALEAIDPRDREKSSIALDALAKGAIDFFHATPRRTSGPGAGMIVVWVRRLYLKDRNLALFEARSGEGKDPSPLTSYLGKEPFTMAVGELDGDWKVSWVSSDISALVGIEPEEMVGSLLIGRVRQQEVALVMGAVRQAAGECATGVRVHLRDADGEWRALTLIMTSFVGSKSQRLFVLTPESAAITDANRRIARLEHHLWNIAGEVEAAGVLSKVGSRTDPSAVPELRGLSARQWEVLSRLLEGERVPTIARELSLSQSTVRNHISAIFKRFGVHSQADLLEAIRQPRP